MGWDRFLPFGDLTSGLLANVGVIGGILLVWGLVNAFFGYKIFKVVLAITGFLAGMVIGAIVGLLVMDSSSGGGGVLILFILLGGVLGAVLAVALHYVGVFLTVGAIAFGLIYLMTQELAVSAVLGVVLGIVGAFLEKYAIIATTGVSGGAMAGLGVWSLGIPSPVAIVLGLLVGIGGIVFQVLLERPTGRTAAAVPAPPYAPAPPPPPYAPPPPSYAPPPPPNAPPQSAAAPGGPCCPNCGSPAAPGSSFCRKCGREIPAAPVSGGVFCTQCGAKMSGSANFCGKCGAARVIHRPAAVQ